MFAGRLLEPDRAGEHKYELITAQDCFTGLVGGHGSRFDADQSFGKRQASAARQIGVGLCIRGIGPC